MEEKKDEVLGLDEEDDTSSIVVFCKADGKELLVSRKAVALSDLLSQALEGDPDCARIEIDHIKSNVAVKAVEFMEQCLLHPPTNIPSPLPSTIMSEIVSPAEAKFVDDLDLQMLFQLLLAANYMAVQALVTLLSAKVASLMKNKSPHNIRKTFGIRDFTKEEEEEVRAKFPDLIE